MRVTLVELLSCIHYCCCVVSFHELDAFFFSLDLVCEKGVCVLSLFVNMVSENLIGVFTGENLQTVDEKFNEEEKKFRATEKTVKTLWKNVVTYLEELQVRFLMIYLQNKFQYQ